MNLFYDANLVFLVINSFIVMCGIYRCDIFITIFLGAFLTNSSEQQINAEEVFLALGK